ncbi:MAG: fdrA domain protein [Clostridiaceae bacterium]|nr:fdrA domain protein [Clostridiaceae bacterium]
MQDGEGWGMTDKIIDLFGSDLVVINVGPRVFGDAVKEQSIEVLQVDWKPIAGGDKEMSDILQALGGI